MRVKAWFYEMMNTIQSRTMPDTRPIPAPGTLIRVLDAEDNELRDMHLRVGARCDRSPVGFDVIFGGTRRHIRNYEIL